MAIIRRNFDYLDKNIFMQLYRSLVRPHLEVSNSAWSPILKQDIETIEDVQKRATRQIPGFKVLEYQQRLKLLGLPTLTYRRLRGDMIDLFKIVNGHYDQEVAPELPKGNSTTRGHNKKLFKKRASRLNCRKHFSHWELSVHGMHSQRKWLMPRQWMPSNDDWIGTGRTTLQNITMNITHMHTSLNKDTHTKHGTWLAVGIPGS